MLPKKQRFTTKLFDQLFRRTKRWKKGVYTFLFVPVKQGGSKYAVVVGKKFFKSAVDRNRIRRQIYGQMEMILAGDNKDFHVICLYNTDQPLQDTSELAEVLREFNTFLLEKGASMFHKKKKK